MLIDIMNNVGTKNSIIRSVKKDLIAKLGKKNIVCAYVYGSTLCEDFCELSDYDFLLFLKKAQIKHLTILKNIKVAYLLRGVTVDFNVQLVEEAPSARGSAFWHNNRAIFIQREIPHFGKLVIGRNIFVPAHNYSKKEQRLEIVRVINSLLYQARKLIVNRELNQEEMVRMMKFCIYAVLYSLAFMGVYPYNKKEAMIKFCNYYETKTKPTIFLELKSGQLENIKKCHVDRAYEFLSELDKIIYKKYSLVYSV